MTTATNPAVLAAPAAANVFPAVGPSLLDAKLQDLDRQLAEIEEKKQTILRQQEEQQNVKLKEKEAIIAECRTRLGLSTDQELIMVIRNRIVPNSKAKRLPESTLKLMKLALAKGCTAPEVAKHFRVSLATVHARKAQWKLTHRKNVKPVTLKEALKGAPIDF